MLLEFIHWNVDPEIFHLGGLSVRWYGLLFAASFYFGYVLFTRFFKLEDVRLEVLDRLTVYMALGTVIGARLGHCLLYEPGYYLSNPLEILKIWHGGLASHGAAIGILVALYLFKKKENRTYFWTLDRIVITVALAGFFIRMGNLMNSEIYGVQTSLPWGFIFDREGETIAKHPTQIYEALSYLSIFLLLYWLYYHHKGKPKEGLLFGLFLILTFTMRFLIEFIKNPQVEFEKNMALDMGQWLSIPFVLAGAAIIYYIYRKSDKTAQQ
ncbi:MAG: prolipoprotein diacylglyceryl transferase [Bacteroidota bacterium]|nr:prolipoprotein diacylglyceryl transferase [Bacteroidota bacterium]